MAIYTVWISLPTKWDDEAMGPHNRLYYTVEADGPILAVQKVFDQEAIPLRFFYEATNIWVNKVVMSE